MLLTCVSLYDVLWTFCWVTLGILSFCSPLLSPVSSLVSFAFFPSVSFCMFLSFRLYPSYLPSSFLLTLMLLLFSHPPLSLFFLLSLLSLISSTFLGMLLNPQRVIAFFVGFLTLFGVVVMKIMSSLVFMREVEIDLHKKLFKRWEWWQWQWQ